MSTDGDSMTSLFQCLTNKYSWNMDIQSEILFERTQELLSMLLKSHMKD